MICSEYIDQTNGYYDFCSSQALHSDPKCEVLINCCLYQEVSRPKGGLSAELCLSVSQKPNWKTHTLNNFLSFFSFFRCSHSRCVQGSREDDDIFGGAGVWCRAVVLCSPHLLPQDTCNPLAVLSLMWTFWWILARTVQPGLWCHFLWVDFFSQLSRERQCVNWWSVRYTALNALGVKSFVWYWL